MSRSVSLQLEQTTRRRVQSHLAGASKAASAFRAALDQPGMYLDLLTFPGYPPEQSDDVRS